jgi:transcriptional regulator with XRE-family HTH domain
LVRAGLKAAIVARGLSQRQLSRLANITENRISEIVNGWVEPTKDERGRLAGLLQQSPDALFDPHASVEIRSAR